jgi:hypothetical protein
MESDHVVLDLLIILVYVTKTQRSRKRLTVVLLVILFIDVLSITGNKNTTPIAGCPDFVRIIQGFVPGINTEVME